MANDLEILDQEVDESEESDEEQKNVIITGIRDIDEKLGGGIPLGSLTLIEGHSDAGKSVLSQHLAHGTLTANKTSVVYYSSENSVKSLIRQMDSLALYTIDYFLNDRFRIYPISLHSDMEDTETPFHLLVDHLTRLPEHFQMAIIDSTTSLLAHSDVVPVIDFFSSCKELCDNGLTILLVTHSYAFDEKLLARTKSLCDAHIKLKIEVLSDRLVKVMEVHKVQGAERTSGDVVGFEVEAKRGMRIIPFSKAKV
jgi:flagellar protein FlaH